MTSASDLHNWNETALWQLLEKKDDPEAADVRATLQKRMPDIQRVLAYGGTSPTDFTLHDSQHAFRVAERMVELVPADVLPELSTYELALLLLAAYLHDIGMSPEQGLVRHLHAYVVTGDASELSQEEIEAFQRWLDEQRDEVTIPLAKDTVTLANLRQASLLLTYYCRASHVDWSEKWIDAHLEHERLGTYAQWIPDLKALCSSHRQGYHKLLGEHLDPKPVGSAGLIVHLRYLAAVLRIADTLEFDPERTPEVVFEHREIHPSSAIFWYKDRHVTPLFEKGRLTIAAEPPDARIHRAVELMTDEIESELRMIRRLDDERPFERNRFREEPLYHQWEIRPDVRRDIRPLGDAYEYINGAFRPDTQKLLHLLSGKELYGNELTAVRELLQNALDAVREQLAYERLEKRDPADPKWEAALGDNHQVELSLSLEDERYWLTCTDDGAGMSKAIINNNLLISGNTRRRDIRLLERRCRRGGFRFERTGQFGIGVLSYFMLADFVQVLTKRSSLAEDAETTGWYFETDGIGSFGELRKDKSWRQGTQVRLRLKREVVLALAKGARERNPRWRWEDEVAFDVQEQELDGDFVRDAVGERSAFERIVLSYVRRALRRLPCPVHVDCSVEETKTRTFARGWTLYRTGYPVEIPWPGLARHIDKGDLVSSKIQQERAFARSYLEQLELEIKGCLSWEVLEGELPDNLGYYRIHSPVFHLPGGDSHRFMRIKAGEGRMFASALPFREGLKDTFTFRPRCWLGMSWKGMTVTHLGDRRRLFHNQSSEDAIIEIDWQDATVGVLSVNREEIHLSDVGKKAIHWVRERVRQAQSDFAARNELSAYVLITHLLVSENTAIDKRHIWLQADAFRHDVAAWGEIRYPVIDLSLGGALAGLREGDRISWNGSSVRLLYPLSLASHASALRTNGPAIIGWSLAGAQRQGHRASDPLDVAYPPNRLVSLPLVDSMRFAGIWLDEPEYQPSYCAGFMTQFPPNWPSLAYVKMDNGMHPSVHDGAWNRDHVLCIHPSAAAQEWAMQTFRSERSIGLDLNPLPHQEPLLADRDKARVWLSLLIAHNEGDLWCALAEQAQDFLNAVWQLIFKDSTYAGSKDGEIYALEGTRKNQLAAYGRSSYRVVDDLSEIKQIIPDPGPDWMLAIVTGT